MMYSTLNMALNKQSIANFPVRIFIYYFVVVYIVQCTMLHGACSTNYAKTALALCMHQHSGGGIYFMFITVLFCAQSKLISNTK